MSEPTSPTATPAAVKRGNAPQASTPVQRDNAPRWPTKSKHRNAPPAAAHPAGPA
ncbi:hypothetical protein GCM10020358_15310 [Amorphoplanes nipponensis]|uniref:Uncharacterized protein n=1 Tax=Actinoplanes nipponensis TaxID=135950 RepID=A0A919JQ54_9ACTN|nr:hypothetical protein [Actinoplanes nipponensis]GIE53295.1 hypothetical protein Ani05nite_68290 [Actinoplanes nipponensis]